MRLVLTIAGAIGVLLGLLWLGQGTGWFAYPRSSFMINQTAWAYRGVGLLALGVAALVVSRSVRRSR